MADLLGFSLWIGVVVVVFVQIWPEVKRRQYKQALDAYEAAAGRQARAGSGQAPDPGERRGSPPGATGMTAATSRDAGPRKGAARRPLGGPYRRTRRRPERHRDDADPDGNSKLELTKYHPPRRSAPSRRTRRPTCWACIASCSPSADASLPRDGGRTLIGAQRRSPGRGVAVTLARPARGSLRGLRCPRRRARGPPAL